MFHHFIPRINYKLDATDYLTLFSSYFRKAPDLSALNNLLGTRDFLFFDHARTGLRFILENKLEPNSRVGIQPLSCPTVMEAIYLANCKPVFVDIDTNFAISPETLLEKIENIDALILTHTFGVPAQVEKIKELLNGKLLIEDCAHSFLTTTKMNNLTGSIGDYSLFSFGFGKFPNAIRGGFVKVNKNDPDLIIKYQQVIKKSTIKFEITNLLRTLVLTILNSPTIYGLITHKIKKNKKLKSYQLPKVTPIDVYVPHANLFVFASHLKNIKESLTTQISNGNNLLATMFEIKNIQISPLVKSGNYFMLPILVANPDNIIKTCEKFGIEIGKHFVKSRFIIDKYGYVEGTCPTYENIIKKLVTLPCHYNYPKLQLLKLQQIMKEYKF
ncbi:MAG: hypothetical protein AUK44_03235 [Porphyromonadaceae bacterium CG2_30_38_12]|nr:MAG: hypothetical protein AUK44_03235 [Porphyromonadaceae bacterium CG2_30_38_12]